VQVRRGVQVRRARILRFRARLQARACGSKQRTRARAVRATGARARTHLQPRRSSDV